MDNCAWEPHLEMNLPAEILDLILSFLQSDPVALRACCESHPSLSKLAEPYLYAHIYLRTDDMFPEQNLGVFDLSKLLSNSPHLVHYVFSLHIVFVKYESDGPDVVNRHVEEISAILPLLSALKTITLKSDIFGGPRQLPECFTLVFLDCLCLPSMQKVRILNFYDIPSVECKPITRLPISRTFELLYVRNCGGPFLNKLSTWLQSQGLRFRSLEFSPDATFEFFPCVLATSSKSLTSLCLDLGERGACFYNLESPPSIYNQTQVIPVTLCTLPSLERLTVRAELRYVFTPSSYSIFRTWGFWSAIPKITQLFPSNVSSIPTSIKHITLDFNCTTNDEPRFPAFSLSEVFVSPLVQLLSSISTFESSHASTAIKVDLYLRGSASDKVSGDQPRLKPAMPLHILLSPLSKCEALMRFVEQGMLSIKPCYSTTSFAGDKY